MSKYKICADLWNQFTDSQIFGMSILQALDGTKLNWLEDGIIYGIGQQSVLTSKQLNTWFKELLPHLYETLVKGGEILVVECPITLNVVSRFLSTVDHPFGEVKLSFASSCYTATTVDFYPVEIKKGFFEGFRVMKKFDAIIGNPPYTYIGSNGKNRPGRQFWHDFVEWSFNHVKKNGLVSMITPDNWLISKEFSNLQVRSENDLTDTFPVQFDDASVSARAWIAYNREYQGATLFDGDYITDMRELPYYPLKGKYLSIFEKVFAASEVISFKQGVSSRVINKDVVDEKDDQHKYPVWQGSILKYWGTAPDNQYLKKVVIFMNSAGWKPFYDDGINGCSDNMYYCLSDSEKQGEKLVDNLNSKIVRFILKTTQRRQSISANVLKNIPVVPFDRTWTDSELYEYFELTDEEISLIEETVK